MSTKLETMEIETPQESPRSKLDGISYRKCLILSLWVCIIAVIGILIYALARTEPVLFKMTTETDMTRKFRIQKMSLADRFSPKIKCSTGFKPTSNGLCVESKFPFDCSPSEPCPTDLICHEGKCSCKYPDYQEYVAETFRCESKVRGPCGPDFPCLKFLECQLFQNRSTGLCKCRKGTRMNNNFHCKPEYPIDCQSSADCKPLANFECTNGTCVCREPGVYSHEAQACVKLVGTPCRLFLSELPCVKNGACRSRHDLDLYCKSTLDDCVCKCNNDYEISPDFTCQKIANPRWPQSIQIRNKLQ